MEIWANRPDAYAMIENRDLIDGLLAMEVVLQAVKDIFGEEKTTPEVICKAIEAGSYLGYRNIMGQAATNVKRY